MTVTSPSRADSRALRRQMRSWRRRRANTTLYEQLSEAYVWVFSAVLIGAMAISALIQTRVSVAAECTTEACGDARTSLLWSSTLGALALVAAVAGLLGPVMVTPAAGSWLLSTPIDRRPVLRSRLLLASAASAVLCGAAVAVSGLLAGLPPSVLACWACGAAIAAAGVTALAAHWQQQPQNRARNTALTLAAIAWAWALLITLGRAPQTGTAWITGTWGATLVGIAVVVAIVLSVRALRQVTALRRADLTASGSVLSSMSGALAGLDFTLAYDVLVARKWRTVATVRSVRRGPHGAWAILWRDVIRLRRSPGPATALAAALIVPYVLVALDLDLAIIPITALTALFGGLWLFPALRTVATSPGLVRCFPIPVALVRAATLAVPGGVVVVWSLAAAPAISHGSEGTAGDALVVSLAIGAAAVVAIARLLLAGPPNYSMPLVTSPAGAIPPGLIISSVRGFDVLALLTIPLLVAPDANGATVSLALCAAVMSALLGRR